MRDRVICPDLGFPGAGTVLRSGTRRATLDAADPSGLGVTRRRRPLDRLTARCTTSGAIGLFRACNRITARTSPGTDITEIFRDPALTLFPHTVSERSPQRLQSVTITRHLRIIETLHPRRRL
ncbi:hypothetical protein, partial [Actinoallomurus spadix]|uniref:hypothetical protein n=1 Tax=Actinoallomurus spadix TaxID=79912 RepID=UPI0031DB1597